MAADALDAVALASLFTKLEGPDVAACAQVCRAWRAVALSEALWEQQCRRLEPHPHLARDDLLPAFGNSWRRYCAWRWPLLRRAVRRIVAETGQQGLQVATFPAPDLPGAGACAGCPTARGGPCAVAAAPGAWVQQPTLSPVGGLLAFTEMAPGAGGELESRVVVADAVGGRRLCGWRLDRNIPPFYFFWTACGTRLLFLSNWEGGVVALRALDVAPGLLPPPPPGAPPLPLPREVLLCTARPLFLCAAPTSTLLVWHGGQRELGLCDAATATCEDGAQHDCFYANPAPCGSQAPQWVADEAGRDWLLLPVMQPQPGEGHAGALVLAPLAGVAAALEAEGGRLPSSLLLRISQRVADFASARDLAYAAAPCGARVAWCDRGELRVWHRASGAAHRVFPPELPQQPPPQQQQQPQQQQPQPQLQQQQQQEPRGEPQQGEEARAGGRRRGRGGGSAGPWLAGAVLAMQWSPDGRRLLFLVRKGGAAPLVTLAKNPHFRWVVYDAPADPPPLLAPGGSAAGWLGSLTQCRPFNPTLEFLDRFLPFFDQYSHSTRLWDPSSAAFCFAARGRPSVPEVSEEATVSVQHVPLPSELAGGSGGQGAALRLLEAPPPEWLGAGNMACWSWQ